MGFTDLYTKFHLPVWLLYGVAYVCNVIGFIIGKKFKLSPFNVCMLTIHRWFSIENATRDLKYEPLFKTEESWSIAGTTYALCVKNTEDQKEREFCSKRAIKAFEKSISINPDNIDNRIKTN